MGSIDILIQLLAVGVYFGFIFAGVWIYDTYIKRR